MRELFSYDSKVMQILLFVTDMIVLNMLFLACCLPVVTIGAAQAGLYSGIAQLINTEDDSSCVKAFFKGFRNGFGRVTAVFSILLGVLVLLIASLWFSLVYAYAGLASPVWLCGIVLVLWMLVQSVVSPFHATFDCTAKNLLRNAFYTVMAHPLRAVLVTALTWAPIILAILNFYLFLQGVPLWVAIYYSFACILSSAVLKKPFQRLKDSVKTEQETVTIETWKGADQ